MWDWVTLLPNQTNFLESEPQDVPIPKSTPQPTAWAAGRPSSPCLAQARIKMDNSSIGKHKWPLAAVQSPKNSLASMLLSLRQMNAASYPPGDSSQRVTKAKLYLQTATATKPA
jgi:hypothetical protein